MSLTFEDRIPVMLNLGLRQEAVEKLKAYVDLLWQSNEDLNLVSRKMEFQELLDNHVIDSLMTLEHFPKDRKVVADFGSGGGFPAVLYAIQFPEIEFHLFEKSPKKQEFLFKCSRIAPNIQVHGEIPLELKGVDLVTARGFKPLDVILDMSRNYYGKNGSYFLLKARRDKIDEELALAKKKFKDLSIEIIPLKSPVLDVERHLVTIRL